MGRYGEYEGPKGFEDIPETLGPCPKCGSDRVFWDEDDLLTCNSRLDVCGFSVYGRDSQDAVDTWRLLSAHRVKALSISS